MKYVIYEEQIQHKFQQYFSLVMLLPFHNATVVVINKICRTFTTSSFSLPFFNSHQNCVSELHQIIMYELFRKYILFRLCR